MENKAYLRNGAWYNLYENGVCYEYIAFNNYQLQMYIGASNSTDGWKLGDHMLNLDTMKEIKLSTYYKLRKLCCGK